jgi:hypothetical protein
LEGGMKTFVVLLLTVLMAACGGKRALRVDCERRLVPINMPAAGSSEIPVDAAAKEQQS